MIQKAYCRKCGAECDARKVITGYNGFSGKPNVDEEYRCPKVRWWNLFVPHRNSFGGSEGKVIEEQAAPDGKWLAEYDPSRQGWTPDGKPMIAHIRVVDDLKDALAFPGPAEALMLYRRADGIRPDGKPNRPLSAFTVEFINDKL